MEDVLDLYAQPYDPTAPQVCFDEKPLVVHGEVREPLPVKPGHPQRSDCEYERVGTANLFVFVEPLAGRRCVEMTEQRTKLDFAQTIRWLVDEVYPEARVIRLVMDNLNTHTAASLYEAFPPAGSAAHLAAIGGALHAQTWQLAQYRRGGDQHF